jgi:hypothetical protein
MNFYRLLDISEPSYIKLYKGIITLLTWQLVFQYAKI